MAVFEQNTSEDVLELHAGSPAESRAWLAAFHLQSHGLHLVSLLLTTDY